MMTVKQARILSGLSCKDVAQYLEITEWEYRLKEQSPWRFDFSQVALLMSIFNCDFYDIEWENTIKSAEKEYKQKEEKQ